VYIFVFYLIFDRIILLLLGRTVIIKTIAKWKELLTECALEVYDRSGDKQVLVQIECVI